MSDILKPIICSQCGSNNVVKISRNKYKCNVCGTTFILDSGEEIEDGFNENEILFINKNKDNVEFIKEAIEDTMKAKSIPAYFLDTCKISFENDYAYAYVIEGTVNVSYKGKVGTHREIIHYKKNKEGETIEEKETVTDWSPISGDDEIETYACAVAARKEMPEFDERLLGTTTELTDGAKAFINEKPMEMTEELMESMYDSLKDSAESEAVSDLYDYDEHEVFSTRSGIKSIDSYKKYLIPTQAIRFSYQNNDYVAYAFARQGARITCDGKAINDRSSYELLVDTNMEKPFLYSTAGKVFYVIICMVLFYFIRKVPGSEGIIMASVFVLIAIAYFVVAVINTQKYTAELKQARENARLKISKIAQDLGK